MMVQAANRAGQFRRVLLILLGRVFLLCYGLGGIGDRAYLTLAFLSSSRASGCWCLRPAPSAWGYRRSGAGTKGVR